MLLSPPEALSPRHAGWLRSLGLGLSLWFGLLLLFNSVGPEGAKMSLLRMMDKCPDSGLSMTAHLACQITDFWGNVAAAP